MFSWFQSKLSAREPQPKTSPANPGVGVKATVAFANAEKSWTEEVDIVRSAEQALNKHGHAVDSHGTWLQLRDSDLVIQPLLAQAVPLDTGGIRTVTTIEVSHSEQILKGIFEYQHSTGDNLEDSITKGFEQWVQLDLVPLLDALMSEPKSCMTWHLSFPAKDGKPARVRRAVLGPVAHLMANPPAQRAEPHTAGGTDNDDTSDDHPFCPCCLLTNSFMAFKELFEGDDFVGIRLFALRNAQLEPEADCRVNGQDWEAGAKAIADYVRTWPDAGFEFRKQYVVIHSMPNSEGEPS